MNNKGASEIISQILLMLITVVVVGIIISALIPQISRSKSQIKFEESKILRDELFFSIQEVYNNPIGYTKEISLKLENLNLNIDGDTETIEIYSIINGEFYKDGLRQEEDNGKYTYREGQKLYAGFTLNNIDLVRSYVLENQLNITIYLRKTDKDKITVLLENVIEDNWFTASNLGLYDENKSTWQYRKKILIDHNKVDGNLTNFPVLIYLEDSDLNLYANADGNDIIFTSKDGKTKLKREIESIKNINTYRKKITIDHTKVDSNLIDFPMLISITDENLATYAQNDGSDIYFTTNDGETRLKREIEDYNFTTGTLIAWVKIPAISSITDTNIYIHFGDEDENNTNDPNVWDSNYVGVWHSQDYNSSTILDSTSNNNTGTKVSENNPIETSGKIGNTQNYTGDDHIAISSTKIETASFWTNLNSVTNVQYILGGSTHGIRYNGTNFLVYNGSTGYVALNWTKVDAWKYITVARINANDYNFYIDGNLLGIATAGTNGSDISITLIGKRTDGYFYNGPIDEIRISNIARSPSWIKTEYNNQSSPETFYSIGDIETTTTTKLVAWVKVPELSTEEDTAIYIYFGNSDANESNDKDVWDEDYVLVNHLTDNLLDSTIIGKQFYNSNATLTTGKINTAFYFDGAYTTKMNTIASNDFNLSNSDFTMSGWFYIPTAATQVSWGGIIIGGNYLAGIDLACGRVLSGSGAPLSISFTSSVPRDSWYYLTLVHNLSEKKGTVYFNGDYKAQDTYPDTLPTTDNKVYLAIDQIHMTGKIDEVRISNIARSAEWIKTEYNNQSTPEEFVKIGILEKA